MRLVLALVCALASTALAQPDDKADNDADKPAETPVQLDPIAKYFNVLESMKLVDIESGNLESLKR
ncbi:MAG: hypothetical protein H0X17_13875, partial [Deltaproteobacteria bacterium]|nr:hypothetical protein [Deltaproteobacteria bacterium]